MIVKHEDSGYKGAFIALEDGVKIGEMTYSKAGTDKIIIDHTEVDENQKGKGVGKILLSKAVDFAREGNIKIVPLCPFAKSVFDKDIDIRDVRA
ncbi:MULTISPECIES: GNAT family N-acetyltransferase [Sphingobacterium]|uniref:N-acetyltransferase n=1 Tax=Sphingobacterium litopenaei TaxID=2763500 RepID=A0ABR7YAT7_9SPHI|nr:MULTISPECIES: GNAT family N-acetyltransferase [Sphingobacterium]MBD1428404.1 N-acetyltransferase [Sphingobacterium litopenaei]NGM71792.1 N-acetyltransferase [Sphingobacterium sp. SGL-16]